VANLVAKRDKVVAAADLTPPARELEADTSTTAVAGEGARGSDHQLQAAISTTVPDREGDPAAAGAAPRDVLPPHLTQSLLLTAGEG
jgi:hypothetical protein